MAFSFGAQKPAGTPGASGTTTPSFGFGSNTNQQQAGATGAAPSSGFSFGNFGNANNASNTTSSTTNPLAFSFANAGNATNNNTANSASSSTPAPKPTFSFGNVGSGGSTTPASSPAPTTGFAGFGNTTGGSTAAASSANAAPSFSFANLNKDKPAAPAPAGTGTGTGTGVPSTGGGLFSGLGQANSASGSTTPASKPPPTTFSFGKPPANPLAPAAAPSGSGTTTPSTGTTTGAGGGAPAPAGGFSLFGAKPAAGPTGTTGAENKDKATAAPASTATPTASAAASSPFGGFKLGGASTTTPASTTPPTSGTSTPAPAPATGGFSFGAKPAEPAKPAGTSSTTAAAGASSSTTTPAPTATTGGFSFGKPAAPAASTTPSTGSTPAPTSSTAASTTAPAKPATGGFSFGGATSPAATTATPAAAATTAATTTTTPAPAASGASTSLTGPSAAASTSKVAVSVPTLLKGLTLEEILNRWSADLDERVRSFVNLSAEVKNWDNLLIRNGEEISALYNNLQALDPVSKTVDESLDYIENQQKEMNSVLDGYESMLDEMLQGRSTGPNPSTYGGPSVGSGGSDANSERERAYLLAEELNNQLDDLSRSLVSLINEVNSLQSPAGGSSALTLGSGASGGQDQDPVQSITAILNAHLSSLNWIEKQSDVLSEQVNELEERMKNVSGGRWSGLSSRAPPNRGSLVVRGTGTPRREGIGTLSSGSSSGGGFVGARSMYSSTATGSPLNASGTPTRFGASTNSAYGGTPGRAGTPSRLGQSSLGRSGIYGLGARR